MKNKSGDSSALPLFAGRSWAVAGELMRPAVEAEVVEGLELFAAAPAAETATAGCSTWKAAMAAEKAAEKAAKKAAKKAAEEAQRCSAELPVQGGEEGFARWKEEAEATRRAFERRWAVPLGKPVRVLLRGESREREGLLRVVEQAAGKTTGQLRLTLGGHSFLAAQIESVVRV